MIKVYIIHMYGYKMEEKGEWIETLQRGEITLQWDIRSCKCGSYSVNPPSSSLTGWDKEIDIQRTIKLVRTQCPGMVQTEVRVQDDEHVK